MARSDCCASALRRKGEPQQAEKPGAGAHDWPTLCNARRTAAHRGRARPSSPPYAHGDGATHGRRAPAQHMTVTASQGSKGPRPKSGRAWTTTHARTPSPTPTPSSSTENVVASRKHAAAGHGIPVSLRTACTVAHERSRLRFEIRAAPAALLLVAWPARLASARRDEDVTDPGLPPRRRGGGRGGLSR